jgi:hypothetical protein
MCRTRKPLSRTCLLLVLAHGCAATPPVGGNGNGNGNNDGGSTTERTVEIPLSAGATRFEIEPGVTVRQADSAMIALDGEAIESGSIGIEAADLAIAPVGVPKVGTRLQGTTVLEITVRIGAFAQQAQVCTLGESYGPFGVSVDERSAVIGVEPGRLPLSATSLGVIEEGLFAFCVEMSAIGLNAMVVLERLTLHLTEPAADTPADGG